MNVLITSVGRRSYIVDYFKKALNGEGMVHVSNSSEITPAFKVADKSVVTPLIYDENYIPFLLNYCKKNKIDIVISLFDIDLYILSINKQRFLELGTDVIVSDSNFIKICNDKWLTYNYLIENSFSVPKTYLTIEDTINDIDNSIINYPVIVKPRWGMGSLSIYVADNNEELKVFYQKIKKEIEKSYIKFESKDNMEEAVLIQEMIRGQEYGLDIINDLNGNYVNTIVKKKYAMRSGETDCAEIVENNELENFGKRLGNITKHVANLDVDIFCVGEKIFVLEMNGRFGGGYPFSHIAGVNLPLAIIKWYKKETVNTNLLTTKKNILAHKDIRIVEIK